MPTTKTVPAQKTDAAAVSPVSNDAEETILHGEPYQVRVTLEGTADILFHRWSTEDVAAKAAAAKNSAAKKTDNVESYVYRTDDGKIGIPGEYLRMAIVEAARYRQDPRSPRKSARDLYKAGVVALTKVAPIIRADGKPAEDWDYLDQRRVMVQRNGVTRVRPAFLAGWTCTLELQVLTPEYIDKQSLLDVIVNAGKLVGLADFRPTYGRYQVTEFKITSLDN